MPMIVRSCTFDGCNVLTIGSRCVEHDVPVTRSFVRGRPFPTRHAAQPMPSRVTAACSLSTSLVPVRRTADTFARP